MKKLFGIVLLLLPLVTFAAPPDKSTHITNNYYTYPVTGTVETTTVTENKLDLSLAKFSANNNAFSALNFERSNKNLQWACGYGFYDTESSVVCGLGYRIGNKNGLLLNGATTIGESERQGNIGIGGTF